MTETQDYIQPQEHIESPSCIMKPHMLLAQMNRVD